MRLRINKAAITMAGAPKRRFWLIGLPILIVVVAGAFAGYLHATRPILNPAVPEEREWTVEIMVGAAVDRQPMLTAFGEIVAGREVDLRPLVAGPVVEVGANFHNGGIVRQRELLIAIDPFDYQAAVDEANAEIAEAEARLDEIQADIDAQQAMLATDREQLALREKELQRRKTLLDKGSGSKKSHDDAVIARNEERQRVLSAHRDIEMLSARAEQQAATILRSRVQLRRAERDLEETKLIAPFDGFLADTDIAIGKRVGTGDRVARLYDAGGLEARFHLSDTQFSRLLASGGIDGRPAQVTWRVGDRETAYDAVLRRSEGRIEASSGGIEFYAEIAGTGPDTLLRPGAFVEIQIPDRRYHDVYLIPEYAIHPGSTIYVVGDDDRLIGEHGEIQLRDGDRYLVQGDFEGRRIVVTDFAEIGPGLLVKVAR
ncbi:MAG: HlyD family efflux transporter periplasmic adaptor subunit [Alphaproteobacteria bacterium]|nr:HlyD family efflux transporter periplasmic adaptor subunit [Alphaproteobacteria bacterium]